MLERVDNWSTDPGTGTLLIEGQISTSIRGHLPPDAEVRSALRFGIAHRSQTSLRANRVVHQSGFNEDG